MTPDAPTPRTRVRRLPELGSYDRATIDAILDEALYCHLAWVTPEGEPRVVPTIHARIDDTLYLHGSSASGTLRAVKQGLPVAIAVTILDGIRFARSMFEHSMNYRSVIMYGTAEEVRDPDELVHVFDAITDQVASGRARDARPPSEDELRQTTFIAVGLDECSAKVSTGQAEDAEDDYALDVWAGVLPLRMTAGEPVADPLLRAGITVPDYVTRWRRPGAAT
jgi:nitroimidazol reductase NimA-like FMN-containing flavoprotein (pyridoxamine 5'-phosphate oxidase superfamily)